MSRGPYLSLARDNVRVPPHELQRRSPTLVKGLIPPKAGIRPPPQRLVHSGPLVLDVRPKERARTLLFHELVDAAGGGILEADSL